MKLSEKTINMLDDKVDFHKAARMYNLLLNANSYLTQEVAGQLDRLAKMLEDVYEGDDGDSLFELAEELESDIMNAQECLESIYDVLSSVTECWPDPDEDYEEEE